MIYEGSCMVLQCRCLGLFYFAKVRLIFYSEWKNWLTPKAYKRIDKALKQHLKSSVSDVGYLRS
jgi:hypothetical protein